MRSTEQDEYNCIKRYPEQDLLYIEHTKRPKMELMIYDLKTKKIRERTYTYEQDLGKLNDTISIKENGSKVASFPGPIATTEKEWVKDCKREDGCYTPFYSIIKASPRERYLELNAYYFE